MRHLAGLPCANGVLDAVDALRPVGSSVRACLAAAALLGGACATSEIKAPPEGKPAISNDPTRAATAAITPLAVSTATAAFAQDMCERTPHSFSQPIALIEDRRIPRYPPVLGFPIAFPRSGNLRSLNGFYASTIDGKPLPTQLEVLSRWGDGPNACRAPIRWAYAWVLADVMPDTRAYLSLRHEPGEAHAMSPMLSIDESEDRVVIDTGPARFTVRKDWFNGLSVVEIATPEGMRRIADVPSTEAAGMLVERDGRFFSPLQGKVLTFEIERRGPHVATLLAMGTYAAKGGEKIFRYTVRMHFYAGTGVVSFDHTYYNGDTTDFTAHGGKNRVLADRVFLRLPLALGSNPEVVARGASKLHRLKPIEPIAIQQDKRSPERPEVVFSIVHGRESLELGTFATEPMLAISGGGAYAIATIAFLGPRDPQAIRFDPKAGALEIDWQSEELFVGGARGIWSKATLDFGEVSSRGAPPDLVARGTQLYAHATRPLIGAPSTAYLNTTRAYGPLPEKDPPSEYERFDRDVDEIHDKTADYIRRVRITGTQLWPDLPREACRGRGCAELEQGYFEGGDNNYWDWSLVELEQFLRTADPSFVHDFALPESITIAETVSFRPDTFTKAVESSFGGFSPCYGSGRGFDGPWLEGLNHRRGSCPGDYSYNKVHKLAYILTADRRFTDFFTQGADTAIRMYKDPLKTSPDEWLELSASRTVYQYLEPLLNAAEFGRIGGDAQNRRYRDTAIRYFDFMRTTTLERGHTCNLLGSRFDDPKEKGDCMSDQAWMLPVWLEWVARLHLLFDHAPARTWILDFGRMSLRRHGVLDSNGLPDLAQERSSSSDDRENGWRTMYRCLASKKGIRDDTCSKFTRIENDGYFYPNGLIAYLNSFGFVLDADPSDPLRICAWLPSAYARALRGMDQQTNQYVWGKELGQAYAMTQRTLGALEKCGK